jgi:hypothetical protein
MTQFLVVNRTTQMTRTAALWWRLVMLSSPTILNCYGMMKRISRLDGCKTYDDIAHGACSQAPQG